MRAAADTFPWLIAGWLAGIYTQMSGWWLNTGYGALVTTSTFAVLAFLVLFFSQRGHQVRLVCLWAGAQAGLVYRLFHLPEGPGTIFPIVIVIGAILSGLVMGLGGSLGWIGGRFVRHA